MKPYYEDEAVTIYHGDCREMLPSMASESIDLLLTDPPYGVQMSPHGRRKIPLPMDVITGDDGSLDVPSIINDALRVLRNNRHFYVFGPFEFDDQPRVLKTAELIWDKGIMSGGDTNCVWGKSHERITFGSRTASAQNKADGYGNGAARLRKGTVLRYDRPNASGAGNHMSEKPVMLLRELIESSSKFGEIVFDPFMGSGSTLVAASLEGRKAIGIEIEERYCEIAAKRLSQGVLALP